MSLATLVAIDAAGTDEMALAAAARPLRRTPTNASRFMFATTLSLSTSLITAAPRYSASIVLASTRSLRRRFRRAGGDPRPRG
jgi:hypothetical protein